MAKETKTKDLKEEDLGDMEFDLVFEKPHLTPDRDEVKEKKEEKIKMRRKRPLPKLLPKINSHEEFLEMMNLNDNEKKGGKKTRKRKTKRKRNKKRKTQKRKHKKRRT